MQITFISSLFQTLMPCFRLNNIKGTLYEKMDPTSLWILLLFVLALSGCTTGNAFSPTPLINGYSDCTGSSIYCANTNQCIPANESCPASQSPEELSINGLTARKYNDENVLHFTDIRYNGTYIQKNDDGAFNYFCSLLGYPNHTSTIGAAYLPPPPGMGKVFAFANSSFSAVLCTRGFCDEVITHVTCYPSPTPLEKDSISGTIKETKGIITIQYPTLNGKTFVYAAARNLSINSICSFAGYDNYDTYIEYESVPRPHSSVVPGSSIADSIASQYLTISSIDSDSIPDHVTYCYYDKKYHSRLGVPCGEESSIIRELTCIPGDLDDASTFSSLSGNITEDGAGGAVIRNPTLDGRRFILAPDYDVSHLCRILGLSDKFSQVEVSKDTRTANSTVLIEAGSSGEPTISLCKTLHSDEFCQDYVSALECLSSDENGNPVYTREGIISHSSQSVIIEKPRLNGRWLHIKPQSEDKACDLFGYPGYAGYADHVIDPERTNVYSLSYNLEYRNNNSISLDPQIYPCSSLSNSHVNPDDCRYVVNKLICTPPPSSESTSIESDYHLINGVHIFENPQMGGHPLFVGASPAGNDLDLCKALGLPGYLDFIEKRDIQEKVYDSVKLSLENGSLTVSPCISAMEGREPLKSCKTVVTKITCAPAFYEHYITNAPSSTWIYSSIGFVGNEAEITGLRMNINPQTYSVLTTTNQTYPEGLCARLGYKSSPKNVEFAPTPEVYLQGTKAQDGLFYYSMLYQGDDQGMRFCFNYESGKLCNSMVENITCTLPDPVPSKMTGTIERINDDKIIIHAPLLNNNYIANFQPSSDLCALMGYTNHTMSVGFVTDDNLTLATYAITPSNPPFLKGQTVHCTASGMFSGCNQLVTNITCTKDRIRNNCVGPGGKTLIHGESATFYKSATVSAGDNCQTESRTCMDGSLSGSFTYLSCVRNVSTLPVASPNKDCTVTLLRKQFTAKHNTRGLVGDKGQYALPSYLCHNGVLYTCGGSNAFSKSATNLQSIDKWICYAQRQIWLTKN